MVRYLKYIVLVFGGIGLMVGGFFFMQNKNDIVQAWNYSDRLDREYLSQQCDPKPLFFCLKKEFASYLKTVSLTGTGFGMKMVFNIMDHEKALAGDDPFTQMQISIEYLEINNLALASVYKRYFGYETFYPGFIGSLPRFYEKGYKFSEDIINGLGGPEGLQTIEDEPKRAELTQRYNQVKGEYFQIKSQVNEFIEKETARLQN